MAIGNVDIVNEPRWKLADGKLWFNVGVAWIADDPPQMKYLGFVQVPLLWILAALVVSTLILWVADRARYGPGQCRGCGYDLTGNVTGVCPECGAAVQQKVART